MNDFHIPEEPDSKTKDDAYKLAMLAAQFERLEGGLDFGSAYRAWKDSINYIQNQYPDKVEPELRFDSIEFKFYKLADALDLMGFVTNTLKGSDLPDQQWKNTIRKKFRRHQIEESEIEQKIQLWETVGVPDYEIGMYKNEKVKLLCESYDVKNAVGFGILFPNKGKSKE
jgi:hypothetical protein